MKLTRKLEAKFPIIKDTWPYCFCQMKLIRRHKTWQIKKLILIFQKLKVASRD